jgi:hypothetical protein
MNKTSIYAASAVLLLSSCGTYTGEGAYVGSQIGAILGSAIGGINDGPRGADMGTIIGMAGGAVAGAVIGSAADRKAEREVHDHYEKVQQARAQQQQTNDVYTYGGAEDSGFDASNSGDDRLYDVQMDGQTGAITTPKNNAGWSLETKPADQPVIHIGDDAHAGGLEIRNVRFVDADGDNQLMRGELCEVSFEVHNTSKSTFFNVEPNVTELTGNKHVFISPGIRVEQIAPGKGIRYTASVKADNRLKDGQITLLASVSRANEHLNKMEFTVPTCKKKAVQQ